MKQYFLAKLKLIARLNYLIISDIERASKYFLNISLIWICEIQAATAVYDNNNM